ncbi:MAG: beta strand repeat-containing protein, partial [Prosthecobacter sp.]
MKTPLQALFCLLLMTSAASAQSYQFDGDLTTPDIQNGNGTWSTNNSVSTNLRWFNGSTYDAWDNSGLGIAEFGNTTSVNGGTITVDGEIKVAGMTFNPLGTPLGTTSHIFTGGTLNFGTGGVINIANAASGGSTGNQWITFTSLLKGSNLTLQKTSGTSLGFARITTANPDLTGTLTLKSATGVTSGIYLSVSTNSFISSLSRVDVQTYSTFNTTGAGPWSVPIAFAGVGGSNYGAIRVDTSNTVFNGGLILTGDGRFHTHINTLNATINGGISEEGGSWAFSRTANSPVNTMTPLITTYTGASTYTGATILGRVLTYTSTSEASGTEGGVNVLNFAATAAPQTDILYNGTTAGTLQLMGGLASRTDLQLTGAAGEANSQRFGATSVQQAANAIILTSGLGGSMSVDLGTISRTGTGVVAITAPKAGQITATVGGSANGLVGTWATYRSADGATAGWAALADGKMGIFTGSLAYQTGTEVGVLPGWSTTADLALSSASTGSVTFGSGVTKLGTLSMTDTASTRQLDLAGKTLRFSESGGIQIIQGAQALTVGIAGDGSTLTAGTLDNTAAQLLLTTMSSTSALTVGSAIVNNGSGALSLSINGTGRTVLTGTNTFTGVVSVMSGVLEARSNAALGATGTTGITKIMGGASLNLSGNITLGETIQANGHGIALDGAIRNLSGTNTITPQVRIQSSTRFTSDSGTLILAGGIIAQIGSTAYTFSGSGNFEVGTISATSGVLNKEGSGTLTLKATSNASGATTVSNGTLHLDFSASTAPATSILYNGVTAAALTLGGTGGGALKATGKADTASSQAFSGVTFAVGSSRVTAVPSGTTGSMEVTLGGITRTAAGATVRFELPTIGSIKTSSGTDNTLLAGAG